MRPHCSLVCAMLLCSGAAWADGEMGRVRPLDPDAVRLLEAARSGSSTVREMLDRLERSDMITYVQFARGPQRPRAVTGIIAAAPGIRYVLISISRFTSEPDRFLLLGHELHHAVELADAPEVRNEAGMAKLYGRIGWRENARTFETAGAQEAGRLVQFEVFSRPREAPVTSAR